MDFPYVVIHMPSHPKKQIKADDQEARRQELMDQGYSAAQIDAIFVRQHRQEVMVEVCRHWFPKTKWEEDGKWVIIWKIFWTTCHIHFIWCSFFWKVQKYHTVMFFLEK